MKASQGRGRLVDGDIRTCLGHAREDVEVARRPVGNSTSALLSREDKADQYLSFLLHLCSESVKIIGRDNIYEREHQPRTSDKKPKKGDVSRINI